MYHFMFGFVGGPDPSAAAATAGCSAVASAEAAGAVSLVTACGSLAAGSLMLSSVLVCSSAIRFAL